MGKPASTRSQKRSRRLSRRRFLAMLAGGTLAPGLLTAGYARYIELHWVRVVRRDLPITNLPASLIGKTLVQISDLHVGPVVDEAYITGAMKKVSSLNADILAITGDFMTYQYGDQVNQVVRVVKHLRPGRLATVAVLGNHDYGPGWMNHGIAKDLTKRLTGLGITVLRNAKLDVQGLQIVGLDDIWSRLFFPGKVLPTLDPGRASVVLCHNPDAADWPVWQGYKGWMLCGHTHGGQCKPPFFAPPILPVRNKRYAAGQVDLADGRRLYINTGLGYLRPVRFNVRPEITVFTLTREA